jgi:hypothetical protein
MPSSVFLRALSSIGRAPALQAGCRRFDSCRVHQSVSDELMRKYKENGMRVLGLGVVMACLVMASGCAMFGGGEGGDEVLGGAVKVTDYYFVGAGSQVGLVAGTNNDAVVAVVDITLSDIDGVPDFIRNTVPNLTTYVIFGAERSVNELSARQVPDVLSMAKDSPIVIKEFYTIPSGQAIDLEASSLPGIVLGVTVDLSKIENVPEQVTDIVSGVNGHLVFGAVRMAPVVVDPPSTNTPTQ